MTFTYTREQFYEAIRRMEEDQAALLAKAKEIEKNG